MVLCVLLLAKGFLNHPLFVVFVVFVVAVFVDLLFPPVKKEKRDEKKLPKENQDV